MTPKRRVLKLSIALLMCAWLLSIAPKAAEAAAYEDLSTGTYTLEAELSCYVPAMGGVEFGDPLLTNASLNVDDSGDRTITLEFQKSSVTIYSVTCDTFIDANPSNIGEERGVKNGTIGYYDENGQLQTQNVSYSLSDDTALNAANEEVQYVDSITFPVTYVSDQYSLTLYINSNVMGVQFCNENDLATAATYPALLSVNWDGIAGQGAISPQDSEQDDSDSDSDGAAPVVEDAGRQKDDVSKSSSHTTVVTKDGLNIHDVTEVASTAGDGDVSSSTPTPYINTGVLTIVGIGAGAVLIAGIVLLVIAKRM